MHRKKTRAWLRASAVFVMIAVLVSFPGLRLQTAWAVDPVVSGTVKTTGGTAIANVHVELHTPDGNFNVNTTTDVTGTYSFIQTLTSGTPYVVEISAPTGYNIVGGSYNFTYAGIAQTANFQVTSASKTVSGVVTNTAGVKITDADLMCDPYNNPGVSRVSGRTDVNGAYSLQMVGGSWFCQAAVNLSEYTPRWITEQAPQRVDFTSDEAVQTQTINFEVTPATGKVSMILLNSDGAKLTSSSFVADIYVSRTDGVGTVRKVQQSDSSLSVYLTPGIYSIAAFHPDLSGKSFDPAATTFVMTENGVVDLGTIQASVDSAHLKGKVTDGAGKGLGGVQVEALLTNGTARPVAATQPDGTYNLTVGGGTWTVGIKNGSGLQYSQVAPVTATVVNGATVSDLNFQVKTMDKTITGNVLDITGMKLTGYVGSAFVQTSDRKAKISAPVINGAFAIQYSSADVAGNNILVGVEASDGSLYTGSAAAKVTINGANATKNLTVKPYDATFSGTLLLPTGAAVTNAGSDISIEAVDESGNFTSAVVGASGAFSLKLAAGTWLYDYNVANPELTDGLLNTPAGQNTLTITAGATKSANLTIRKGTNTITGTVKDSTGAVMKSATVILDNSPTIENNSSNKGSQIVSASVLTNGSGVYTAKVPDGTYLVSVGDTPAASNSDLPPDGKSVTVAGSTTKTQNLTFENASATVKGTVKTNGKNDGGGTINAYSDNGKEVSATIGATGAYTLKLTPNDKWHISATDLSGKNLMESEAVDITPKAGTTTANLTMKDSGIDMPGPATKSCSADTTCSVSLPDGTTVTVPAFGIDLSGTVKLTVTPTVDMDQTATDTPATLAYEVKAVNNSGYEVKDLNKPAEVTVPYNQDDAAKSGLIESRLTPSYYDPNTNTWSDAGASGLVDTKNNVATIRTEHFTKFSVTGTTKPLPKITKVTVKNATSSTATITVEGKNFTGKMSATIGTVKAKSATLKNGIVTLVFDGKKVGQGTKTLTITSGNGRKASYTVVTAKNLRRIQLK